MANYSTLKISFQNWCISEKMNKKTHHNDGFLYFKKETVS